MRKIVFLLALTIALSPPALANEDPPPTEANDRCPTQPCIIHCFPVGFGLTGETVPPIWVDVYETCLPQ